jgi:hypothetical protein
MLSEHFWNLPSRLLKQAGTIGQALLQLALLQTA